MIEPTKWEHESFRDEMSLLSGLVNLLTGIKEGSIRACAFGLLPQIKRTSECKFKIKTIKICFVLNDEAETKMHKDIDWEAL